MFYQNQKLHFMSYQDARNHFSNPLNQHHQDFATMLVMYGVKNEKK